MAHQNQTATLNSTLNQTAQQTQQQTKEQSYPEFEGKFILHPKEIDKIWNSEKPKDEMLALTTRLIKDLHEKSSNTFNNFSQYEDRYEKEDEQSILAEYCLQNLVFIKHDAKISDNYVIVSLMNTFFDMLSLGQQQNYDGKYNLNDRIQLLLTLTRQLHERKLITKEQIKSVLDYAQRTICKHLPLFALFLTEKRPWYEKQVKIIYPQQQIAGNLATECREIVDEKADDQAQKSQQDFYQEEGEQRAQEEDIESVIDPEDPLYGLDLRLRNMSLDDESRRIIKEKLEEANNRIKMALEERQKNLDSKLAGDKPGAPKKK